MNIQDYIRIVPDFPKPGINFYDIATLLAEPAALSACIHQLKDKITPYRPQHIIGIEARGFIIGVPLALSMDLPFGMIRKKGKLPGKTLSYSYDLEYGADEIEIQSDLLPAGTSVALIDDLLATGGTLSAAETLIKDAGSLVTVSACIVELDGLKGREKLASPFETLLTCPA